jgi:hypothetical protein
MTYGELVDFMRAYRVAQGDLIKLPPASEQGDQTKQAGEDEEYTVEGDEAASNGLTNGEHCLRIHGKGS